MSKDQEFINIPYRSAAKIANEGILKGMRSSARKYAKGKLADIGCGTKPYENIFLPFVESYFGIDHQPTAAANYKELTRADLFVDCLNTGLADGSFDTLLSTQVMEHIYETGKYIKECNRLLKSKGTGIFTVPMSWRCHGEPYDYYRFTRYALEKLFKENGFEILELTELEGPFASVAQHLIIDLHNRPVRNNAFFKYIFHVLFSVMNFIVLKLGNHPSKGGLCLNYLLVVRKKWEN